MDNLIPEEVYDIIDKSDIKGGTNTSDIPKLSKSIKNMSEETYLNIVQDVVGFSKENLSTMHEEKLELRSRLIDFCLQVLAIQMIFLIIFLLFAKPIGLSDGVLSVFMTAVFVETLGAVIVMIKYAFKSDEEVKIIDILNAVVKNFQKYTDDKNNDNWITHK